MGNIYEELRAAQGRSRPKKTNYRSDYEAEIERFIFRLGKSVRNWELKDRKRVLTAAAAPVRKEARIRARSRKGNRTTLIYQRRGPKRETKDYSFGNRAGRKNKEVKNIGKRGGRLSSSYAIGNLANSISTLQFRGSPDVFVGARFGRGGLNAGTKIGNADGWYADLAYGGNRGDFRKQILVPAARKSIRQSIERMKKKAIAAFKNRAAKQGLDVN